MTQLPTQPLGTLLMILIHLGTTLKKIRLLGLMILKQHHQHGLINKNKKLLGKTVDMLLVK